MDKRFPSLETMRSIWQQYIETGSQEYSWTNLFFQGVIETEEMYKNWLRIFEYLSGKNVLDIGCGAGELSMVASYVADNVLGIDKRESLKKSWLTVKLLSGQKNISFEIVNAKKMAAEYFKQNSINAVLMNGLAPPFGRKGIGRLYKLADQASIELILASQYTSPKKLTKDAVYDFALKRHPCLKNYEVIDTNHSMMVLRRRDA